MKLRRNTRADDRLKRLADNIEVLVRTDEVRIREERRVTELRSKAARELHTTCSGFVASVNGLLGKPLVDLSPAEFTDENYRDAGSNLFQVNVAGRLIQIEFRATDAPTSTEQYRVPYIMQGEVRCLNQEAIERAVIPEHLLFYCLEKNRPVWILFDPRTHRTADFDQECLISLMERLV